MEQTWVEIGRGDLVPGDRVLVEWPEWDPAQQASRYWVPLTQSWRWAEGQPTMVVVEGARGAMTNDRTPEGRTEEATVAALLEVPEGKSPIRDAVLAEAGRLIGGDRATTYGDAGESHARIGKLWSALLGVDVSATDVARCMVAMKLSRLHESPTHSDSWIDIAGYAALGAEIAGARP